MICSHKHVDISNLPAEFESRKCVNNLGQGDCDHVTHALNQDIYSGGAQDAMDMCDRINQIASGDKRCDGFDIHKTLQLYYLNAQSCNDDAGTDDDNYNRYKIVSDSGIVDGAPDRLPFAKFVHVAVDVVSIEEQGCGPALYTSSSYDDVCGHGPDDDCNHCAAANEALGSDSTQKLMCLNAHDCAQQCRANVDCFTYQIWMGEGAAVGCLHFERGFKNLWNESFEANQCAIGGQWDTWVAAADKQLADENFYDVCRKNTDCSLSCSPKLASDSEDSIFDGDLFDGIDHPSSEAEINLLKDLVFSSLVESSSLAQRVHCATADGASSWSDEVVIQASNPSFT